MSWQYINKKKATSEPAKVKTCDKSVNTNTYRMTLVCKRSFVTNQNEIYKKIEMPSKAKLKCFVGVDKLF